MMSLRFAPCTMPTDFKMCNVQSQLVDDYKGRHGDLSVKFVVQEGQQTRVASLAIEGNQQLSMDEILGVVGSSKGQPYSEFNVSTDRDNILATYYDQGFSEARFTADLEKVPAAGSKCSPMVRLTYHITEGRQVRVARVLLSGYEHTRPGVISRRGGNQSGRAAKRRRRRRDAKEALQPGDFQPRFDRAAKSGRRRNKKRRWS